MNTPKPSSISASRTTARRAAGALGALALALIAIDQGGGWLLRQAFRESGANPIARPLKAGAETLILGSSTAKRALDPAALWPNAYNAAEDGQGLFFVSAYMRNLPEKSGLRRVIVGIDPGELVEGYRSPNTRHLKRLSAFAIGDAKLRAQLALFDPDIALKFHSGLYPFRGDFAAVLWRRLRPGVSGNGYAPLSGAMKSAPPPPARPQRPAGAAPESRAAIADIAEAARRRGIALIFVVSPMAGSYRPERDAYFAPALADLREAAGAYPCDLIGADSAEIDAIAAAPALFHDAPHLNGAGARRFSAEIRRLIEARCPAR